MSYLYKTTIALIVILVSVFLILISVLILSISTSHQVQTGESVKCYDNNNNIIENQYCQETINCDTILDTIKWRSCGK